MLVRTLYVRESVHVSVPHKLQLLLYLVYIDNISIVHINNKHSAYDEFHVNIQKAQLHVKGTLSARVICFVSF